MGVRKGNSKAELGRMNRIPSETQVERHVTWSMNNMGKGIKMSVVHRRMVSSYSWYYKCLGVSDHLEKLAVGR